MSRNRQRHYSSKSGSSFRSSSESSYSSDASSNVSSLASVAVSWKAVCAKIMRDYIDSPKRGCRYDSQQSSRSNSSTGSRSNSRRPSLRQNRFGYRFNTFNAGGNLRNSRVDDRDRAHWKSGKYQGSDQLSRSPSGPFERNRRYGAQNWATGQ